MKIEQTLWSGSAIYLFKLVNVGGAYVMLTNYGATIVSLVVPDRHNNLVPVVLGFSDFKGYQEDTCYMGSTVGRYANRIANAQFALNGKTYTLDKNDGENSNHGGLNGFHTKVFEFEVGEDSVTFFVESEAGESGFPGNVKFSVKYTWNDLSELRIEYSATTDADTVLNFTNHAYFNLAGGGNILEHQVMILAANMLQTNDTYIPTGKIVPSDVPSGKIMSVQERVNLNNQGLNHFYVFQKDRSYSAPIGKLVHDGTGISLTVWTSYPGVQLYSGDYLNSTRPGHHGKPYGSQEGICLECQLPPDSPNHAHFPSSVLKKGEELSQYIVYKFEVL